MWLCVLIKINKVTLEELDHQIKKEQETTKRIQVQAFGMFLRDI